MAAGTAWVLDMAPHVAPYVLALIALYFTVLGARRALAHAARYRAEQHRPPHNGPHPTRRTPKE